jgi:ABC-type xylose transport system substrate-binding protein
VATLDAWLEDIVRSAAEESGKSKPIVVGPSGTLSDLKDVADGLKSSIIWQDPGTLAAKTVEIVSVLLAGTTPNKIAGATSSELAKGAQMFSVVLNPTIVEGRVEASNILKRLEVK